MRTRRIRSAAEGFIAEVDAILSYLARCEGPMGKQDLSWSYEYGVLRLYRAFECFMFDCLVASVNSDIKGTIVLVQGVKLPHLPMATCEYLISRSGYFSFTGRDGLIKELRRYLPKGHPLVAVVSSGLYRESIELLMVLRNYAAHGSGYSRLKAKEYLDCQRLGSAGSWLKSGGRFKALAVTMQLMAQDLIDRDS